MAFHSIKSLHKLTRITSAADSCVSSHGEEPDNQTKYKAPSQYRFHSFIFDLLIIFSYQEYIWLVPDIRPGVWYTSYKFENNFLKDKFRNRLCFCSLAHVHSVLLFLTHVHIVLLMFKFMFILFWNSTVNIIKLLYSDLYWNLLND